MKTQIIEGILNIPKKFYNEKTISFVSLLKETKYAELANQITENDILNVLLLHQDYINDWLKWSESKRTDEGWCLIKNENKYDVVYMRNAKQLKKQTYYDGLEACASFIKKEIDSMV